MAELSPLCVPGPRTRVPRAVGVEEGLSLHSGHRHLRFCSAPVSLCLAVLASPQPGELASGSWSEAPEGTAATGGGKCPLGGVLVVAAGGTSLTQ